MTTDSNRRKGLFYILLGASQKSENSKETASPGNLYIILTKGDKLCKNDETKGKGYWLLESKYIEKLMEDKEFF